MIKFRTSGTFDSNAYHDNQSNEYNSAETVPYDDNLIISVEDPNTSPTFQKKKITASELKGVANDPEAFHKNIAAEYNGLDTVAYADDLVLSVEDPLAAGTAFDKKKVLASVLKTDSDAFHKSIPGEIEAINQKGVLLFDDLVLIEDSADSYDKNGAKIGAILNFVKANFADTIWNNGNTTNIPNNYVSFNDPTDVSAMTEDGFFHFKLTLGEPTKKIYEIKISLPKTTSFDITNGLTGPVIECSCLFDGIKDPKEVVTLDSINLTFNTTTNDFNVHFNIYVDAETEIYTQNFSDSTIKISYSTKTISATPPADIRKVLNPGYNRNRSSLTNSGAVTIISNGDTSKPTLTMVPATSQQLSYVSPLLDPNSYPPEYGCNKDGANSIYYDDIT